MSLPAITAVGNLVADPELRFTPSGAPVLRFTIACTDRYLDRATNEWKDGDRCFLPVEIWRKAAENVAESLLKGMEVIVVGSLRTRSYETAEGEKRQVTELKADHIGPGLGRQTAKVTKVSSGQGPVANASTPAARPQATPATAPATATAPTPAASGGGMPLDEPPF